MLMSLNQPAVAVQRLSNAQMLTVLPMCRWR